MSKPTYVQGYKAIVDVLNNTTKAANRPRAAS